MSGKISRKATLATVAVVLGTTGSALFTGAAFAGGGDGEHNTSGGPGGNGGETKVNCVLPLGLSLGILGQGDGVSQCNATGGGGGTGGTGANY